MTVAEAVTVANDATLSLWYPTDRKTTDQYERTVADYQAAISELVAAPVHTQRVRADGGQPSVPDLLVRRGADETLRSVLFDGGPTFPTPGCTTVTVYTHESRHPPLARRLFEYVTF